MNTFWIILGFAVLVAAYLWVRNSNSTLADSLRAMFKSKEKEAADAVDSVENRVNSGLLKQEELLKLARMGTYQVKITLAEREQVVAQWQTALDQARKDKDAARTTTNRDAFVAACRNYDRAVTKLTSATTARDQIQALVTQMENQVDTQYDEKDAMEEEGAQLAAQAVVDDTTAKFNEAKAGLTKADGGKSDFAKAHEIADKLHARATAATGAAGGLTQREREEQALKALRTNVTKTNVDDEWNRVGERLASERAAK